MKLMTKMTYIQYLNLRFVSAIKFIRSKKRTDIQSMYDQLIKMSASNLKKLLIDEVLSKILDYNLVSNKKSSAGLDSF